MKPSTDNCPNCGRPIDARKNNWRAHQKVCPKRGRAKTLPQLELIEREKETDH